VRPSSRGRSVARAAARVGRARIALLAAALIVAARRTRAGRPTGGWRVPGRPGVSGHGPSVAPWATRRSVPPTGRADTGDRHRSHRDARAGRRRVGGSVLVSLVPPPRCLARLPRMRVATVAKGSVVAGVSESTSWLGRQRCRGADGKERGLAQASSRAGGQPHRRGVVLGVGDSVPAAPDGQRQHVPGEQTDQSDDRAAHDSGPTAEHDVDDEQH
jgi:hypothetical protein